MLLRGVLLRKFMSNIGKNMSFKIKSNIFENRLENMSVVFGVDGRAKKCGLIR